MSRLSLLSSVVVVLFCVLPIGYASAGQAIFADVGGEMVSKAEFDTAVNIAMRQRFYHGRMDDERLDTLRHEVAADIVDELLLKQEAQRRKIEVDNDKLDQAVGQEVGRFRLDGLSDEQKSHLFGMVRQQATEKLLVKELRSYEAARVEPALPEIKEYYKENLDKFTTPEQQHLAVILLKVTPSSSVAVWQAAKEEADKLRLRLDGGADFGDLANLHSGDASAEVGGDLGFVHKGMLAKEAQDAVNSLSVGEVSEPVTMLQGVALFKLKGLRPAQVNSFDKVKERARGLLSRELVEQGWGDLLKSLRERAAIKIFDEKIIMEKMWVNKLVVDGR